MARDDGCLWLVPAVLVHNLAEIVGQLAQLFTLEGQGCCISQLSIPAAGEEQ
jgi:hypothetical protein